MSLHFTSLFNYSPYSSMEVILTNNFSLAQHQHRCHQYCTQCQARHALPRSPSHEEEAAIADSGAIMVRSGEKTGRSPSDKRIVEHPDSKDDIWWGSVNVAVDEHTFEINRERAIDYLNTPRQSFML